MAKKSNPARARNTPFLRRIVITLQSLSLGGEVLANFFSRYVFVGSRFFRGELTVSQRITHRAGDAVAELTAATSHKLLLTLFTPVV